MAGVSPPLPALPNVTTFKGKLLIFSNAYESRTQLPYTQSMVATAMVLERMGIHWDYWPCLGDFHVNRAVNEALTRAMRDDEVTDVLMIDTDERWDPMGVLRLLSHPDEIVGGAYRMKNAWDRYTCVLKWRRNEATGKDEPVGRLLGDGTALLEATRIPGGFMRIKTSALRKFEKAYPDRWYHHGEGRDVQFFGGNEVVDHVFQSMDHAFCLACTEIGIPLWIDPNISIAHYGLTGYEGNLDQYLRNAAAQSEMDQKDQEALAAIQSMAADIAARAAA